MDIVTQIVKQQSKHIIVDDEGRWEESAGKSAQLTREGFNEVLDRLNIKLNTKRRLELFEPDESGCMSAQAVNQMIKDLGQEGMWFDIFQAYLKDCYIEVPDVTAKILFEAADRLEEGDRDGE